MKQTMDNYNPAPPPYPNEVKGKVSLLKSLVRPLVCPCFVRTMFSEALKLS